MDKEKRIICFDNDLKIEAYCFKGIMQKFPNHFHEHYVIGFVENGKRKLSCKNKEYIINSGDIILFNPFENHTCEQLDNMPLDYRCLNINTNIMQKMVFEINKKDYIPEFSQNVIIKNELFYLLHDLHKMILEKQNDFHKEELFFFLIEQLIAKYSDSNKELNAEKVNNKIELICKYLENNYSKRITLDELADLSSLNKYYLLRAFTKFKGITPYRYLQNIRINKAQKMLENGTEVLEAAMSSGFSDQSHFTNFFKEFTGLTPKQYQNIFIETNK